MRATPLLLGCVVFLGCVATCDAADAICADSSAAGTQRMSSDNSTHDSATSGDDVDISHRHATSTSSSGNSAHRSVIGSGNVDDGGGGHIGDSSSAPPVHRANLGWQSLLPGSIQ